MEILLSFPEKPRTAKREHAKTIARENGARNENGRVLVRFDSITPSFKDLIRIVGNWKATQLSIDNTEYDRTIFHTLLTCQGAPWCTGYCGLNERIHLKPYRYFFSSIEDWANGNGYDPNGPDKDLFDRFTRRTDDDTMIIDKKGLSDAVLADSWIPLMICEKCTAPGIMRLVHSVPDTVRRRPPPPRGFGYQIWLEKKEKERKAASRQGKETAEESEPQSLEDWFNIGLERGRRNDHAGAIEAYDRILVRNPDHPETLFNRGYALLILGRYEEAETSFAKASECFSNDGYTFKYWALACQGLGKEERAAELMARAEQLQPGIRDETFP